jgi:hypothetical protein
MTIVTQHRATEMTMRPAQMQGPRQDDGCGSPTVPIIVAVDGTRRAR